MAVDGSKTKLDDAMYNKFVSDLDSSQVVIVDVNGMVCDFCARGIEKTFYDDNLVKRVLVSLETGKVLIAYDNAKKVDFGEIKEYIFIQWAICHWDYPQENYMIDKQESSKLGLLTLIASTSTLICCALPALFGTWCWRNIRIYGECTFPQLVIISHYKVYISVATLIILILWDFLLRNLSVIHVGRSKFTGYLAAYEKKGHLIFTMYLWVYLYLLASLRMFCRSIYRWKIIRHIRVNYLPSKGRRTSEKCHKNDR